MHEMQIAESFEDLVTPFNVMVHSISSDSARDLWESCLYLEFTPVDDPT